METSADIAVSAVHPASEHITINFVTEGNHFTSKSKMRNCIQAGLGCYTRPVSLSGPFIIFGAGNLGRRVARALNPQLFCDNNSRLWGTSINDIPVESPASAVSRYPDATYVVAIWNPSPSETMLDRIAQIRALGAHRVVPFTELLKEHADHILPNLLWEKREFYTVNENEIGHARSLLNPASRPEFDRQLRLRSADFAGQVIDAGTQYFPPEIVLDSDEVFIDCGAFDGDTVEQFSRATGNRFKQIMAFEPDPVNLAALHRIADADRRVSVLPYAVGACRQVAQFTIAGPGSHVSQAGECEVQVTTLDEALQDIQPTYIKMDIEGSELDALEGGKETIRRHRPKMAVCVYHLPDHLWQVPIKLHELLPDSDLTLRTYNADGFECVCYCIPR
jgi:FkbM family methyltransferase